MSRGPHVVERTVGEQHAGAKLRNFLVQEFRDVLAIRADIIAALRQKHVLVNGKHTLDSHLLQTGDCVSVTVDPLQALKSRVRALDVEVRYSEPGVVVLLKAPGVSQPEVEWSAPALLAVEKAIAAGYLEECAEIQPWVCVNKVDKGARSLIILVDTEEKQREMAHRVAAGQVLFQVCAVCHGSVDQRAVDKTTTQSLKQAAAAAAADSVEVPPQNQAEAQIENEPCMFEYDAWVMYNRFPADIFDHIETRVVKTARSSTVGHLSLIESTVSRTTHPSLVLRRYMYEIGKPVVGTQNHARPLPNHRDKGALLAITGITMLSPAGSGNSVSVSVEAPPKLLAVCEREAKFYDQRKQKAQQELEKYEEARTAPTDCSEDSAANGTPAADVELVDGMPAAYISGFKEFCGHTFHVSPDTLIPRSSTQTLVGAAASLVGTDRPRFIDLGTGSGCVLLSILLRMPYAAGVGIDISSSALRVASQNCQMHNLHSRAVLLEGSFEGFSADARVLEHGPFDMIVCNPPYISAKKASRLRASFEHEPSLALVADDGGYQAYRQIHASLSCNMAVLRTGGLAGFEIGKDMEKGVRRIFADWKEVGAFKDSHGFLRVLVFQKPSN
ncbi:hypothetical protein GGF40_003351 [Coemansia sp. RSA 1286]|nr:hypothetical protein GGF40_003351 [Coemansia sp. RSA 1286]